MDITIILHDGSGRGAYGTAESFEKAHMMAWEVWWRNNASKAPASCSFEVFDHLTSNPCDADRKRIMTPPAVKNMISHFDPVGIPADEDPAEVKEHVEGCLEEVKCSVAQIEEAIAEGPAVARFRILTAVRDLLDLDEGIGR